LSKLKLELVGVWNLLRFLPSFQHQVPGVNAHFLLNLVGLELLFCIAFSADSFREMPSPFSCSSPLKQEEINEGKPSAQQEQAQDGCKAWRVWQRRYEVESFSCVLVE